MFRIKKSDLFFILIVIILIILIILSLPYVIWYKGILQQKGDAFIGRLGMDKAVIDPKYPKMSVETSFFKFQKQFTVPDAIKTLSIAGDDDSVIKYSKEVEKYNLDADIAVYDSIVHSYENIKDYDNALKWAEKSNNSNEKLRIYILKNDSENAEKILGEIVSNNLDYKYEYFYKSKISIIKNDWKGALGYVNSAISKTPDLLSVWELKKDITLHLGLTNEYKKCENKISQLKKEIGKNE